MQNITYEITLSLITFNNDNAFLRTPLNILHNVRKIVGKLKTNNHHFTEQG